MPLTQIFLHSLRLAYRSLGISESCYHYCARLSGENALVADWLLRLTYANKQWGFWLCFLYLRNVKGFRWNHKCVYRIYRELKLNPLSLNVVLSGVNLKC